MSLFNVSFDDFGGLDLSSAADETAGALDLLNVDFDQPGRVRSRDGYSTYLTHANPITHVDALPYGGKDDWVFVADSLKKLAAYEGGILRGTISSAGTNTYKSFAHIGTPTTETVYAVNGIAAEGQRWDNPTGLWTTVTLASGTLACASPLDNRLVIAGSISDPSRVQFSDPGSPTVFGTNNYVDLEPGTSGPIVALVTWQNFVFAFKSDRFYVFYGTSTDSTGNPVFNYRAVYCGVGPASQTQVAVSPSGVYFLDPQHGVYVTTGGQPVRLGGLEPLFSGQLAATYFAGLSTSGAAGTSLSTPRLSYANERLFLTGQVGTSTTHFLYGTFAFHTRTQVWSYWTLPIDIGIARAVEIGTAGVGVGRVGPVFMSSGATSTSLFVFGGSTDGGGAFSASYRSGFQSFDWRGRNLRSGIHNVEKIVRESMVDGTGSVSYTLSNQWVQAANLPAGRTLTLGTAPQVKQARDRTAVKGREFSFQISGTAPWTVEKVVLALHGYEDAGLRETGN